MALSAPIINFPWSKLEALYPGEASEVNINLAPNSTLVAGTVLGQVTTSANDVQTLTIGGTPTGGTFPISGVNPFTGAAYTITPVFNAATSVVQAALVAIYGTGNVAVTGSAGTSYVITSTGAFAKMPMPALTTATTGLTGGTPTAAFVHTTTGTTLGTYGAYASGNSDGTQTAKLLLSYTVATDSSGNHFFAGSAASEWGQVYSSCPAYRNGTFASSALTGLDSGAVTSLGRLIQGTTTAGILQLI